MKFSDMASSVPTELKERLAYKFMEKITQLATIGFYEWRLFHGKVNQEN